MYQEDLKMHSLVPSGRLPRGCTVVSIFISFYSKIDTMRTLEHSQGLKLTKPCIEKKKVPKFSGKELKAAEVCSRSLKYCIYTSMMSQILLESTT